MYMYYDLTVQAITKLPCFFIKNTQNIFFQEFFGITSWITLDPCMETLPGFSYSDLNQPGIRESNNFRQLGRLMVPRVKDNNPFGTQKI